jgi:hypothetical protein
MSPWTWKIGILVAFVIGGGIVGYRLGTRSKGAPTVSQAQTPKVQTKAKTVTVRTTKIHKAPSGDTTTVIKETETRHESEKASVPVQRLTYSVEVRAIPDLGKPLSERPDYQIEFGRRLVSDLWTTVSYDVKTRGIGLGVRLDF